MSVSWILEISGVVLLQSPSLLNLRLMIDSPYPFGQTHGWFSSRELRE
jgi:hypothetical protein